MDEDKMNIIYQETTFLDALCLLLIILKTQHAINWSWWVILSPIWMQFILAIIILIFVFFKLIK
jgi:membrane protein YdbS with pleckstrin-like domain